LVCFGKWGSRDSGKPAAAQRRAGLVVIVRQIRFRKPMADFSNSGVVLFF
jgi:hypothetical protein